MFNHTSTICSFKCAWLTLFGGNEKDFKGIKNKKNVP